MPRSGPPRPSLPRPTFVRRLAGLLLLPILPLTASLPLSLAFAAGPPPCRYEDRPARIVPEDDGRWTVLDTVFRLPADWRPTDLVPARRAGFEDDRLVREVLVPSLAEMLLNAAADGHPLELQSAFRSHDYQARTFDSWVRQQGRERALATSARAGHSEHQLGTAIDLRSAGGPAPWDHEDWARTPEGAWLKANAWRYGFVMSYPRGARERSCYAYEPWHWRWVGRELAERVHREDLLLREALWELRGAD